MELGNQIKSLRLSKGLTQEALAEQLGVTAQAVSKWERNAALPDIGLLPQLSVLFGVTIDQLFAISDEDRLDRIQNMLWDERVLDPLAVERERAFLLEKARREPENGRPHELLADMENHLANQHRVLAADYAKESLRREPRSKDAHSELFQAFGGGWTTEDWYAGAHNAGIDWCKDFVAQNPDYRGGYLWLMDLLLTDCRVDEAQAVCDALAKIDDSYRLPLYRGHIAWAQGDRETAQAIWEQMCRDFPGEWCVWLSMGNVHARTGRFAEAAADFRKAMELQEAPRYVDPLESIALVKEIMGDIPGAMAALEEEIALLADEWNSTAGETVDKVRREMERLKKKL